MTIQVGNTLPEATLYEFMHEETGGCSLGPNAFKVSDLVKGKKIAILAVTKTERKCIVSSTKEDSHAAVRHISSKHQVHFTCPA